MSRGAAPAPAAGGRPDPAAGLRPSLSGPPAASLGEGRTPLVAAPGLGGALGLPDLWLKREDCNPTGSHKARALALQADALRRSGQVGVLSSSGNAAVAAAAYGCAAGARILVLVSPRTPRVKLRRLAAFPGPHVVSPTPVALLRRAVDDFGCEDLRPSVHRLAPAGCRGIAEELLVEMAAGGPPDAVFVYASSGATVVGLAEGFGARPPTPAIHVVHAPALGIGDLGARRSRRAAAVRRVVTATGGRRWVPRRDRLEAVRELAAAWGVATSWEGLAVLAAVGDAASELHGLRVVALLTGDADQLDLAPDPDPAHVPGLGWVETPAELERELGALGLSRR